MVPISLLSQQARKGFRQAKKSCNGKYLRACCDSSQAGTANQEGLPNIVAEGTGYWRDKHNSAVPTGAAYKIAVAGYVAGFGSNNEQPFMSCFDASRSNSVYGSSEKVVPRSVNILVAI